MDLSKNVDFFYGEFIGSGLKSRFKRFISLRRLKRIGLNPLKSKNKKGNLCLIINRSIMDQRSKLKETP